MKIEELPSGAYRVRKMVQGKSYSFVFPSKPTQKEIAIELAKRIQEPQRRTNSSFKAHAEEYIANRSNVLSPSTIRTYNIILGRLSDNFKRKRIYDIGQEEVQIEINRLAKELAPKTVKSTHGFIASVLAISNPNLVLRTTLPQAQKKARYCPNTDDIRRLLEYAKGGENSIGYQLGILGMRRSEICALELSDLNGNMLTINKNLVYNGGWQVKKSAKTDAGNRKIMLPDKLVEEIQEKGYFFKYSPKKLNQHLAEDLAALGIPKFRFHDLRAYFASYAHAMLGLSDKDIMTMGGWKTDHIMKDTYIREMEESLKISMKMVADSII